MKSKLIAAAAAALCLGTGIASAAPATALGQPRATAGLLHESYISARAQFGINLSADSGLASYDVRHSASSMRARHRAAWTAPRRLQHLPVSGTDASIALVLPIRRGRVVCVSVRATDVDGTTGPWSAQTCAVRAIDDAAVVRHGRTRIVRDSRYWGGRARVLGRQGRMALRGVQEGSRVVVIVTDLNQNRPRDNGRNLPFTVPSQHAVLNYTVGWRWGRTLHTQATMAGRPSGRFGPVVFHGPAAGRSPAWTSPLEGIAIRPAWLSAT